MNKLIIPNKNFIRTFFVLIYFSVLFFSFYSALYYITDTRDEIRYLSDRLLLFESLRPSMSHSPQGISLWVGFFYLIFEAVYNFFYVNSHSVENFFFTIDKIIYKNYLDLTNLKLLHYVLVISFLIYFYKKNYKFFFLFILIFFSFLFWNISYSAKPQFLASIFFSLSLIFSQKKNKFKKLIFFSLACSERLEFLVFINYICDEKNLKNQIKNYFIIFLLFATISPWFSFSIIHNFKSLINYIITKEKNFNGFFFFFFNYAKIIIFFTIICLSLILKPVFSNKKKYIFISIILALICIQGLMETNIPMRWYTPQIIIFLYFIYFYLKKNTKIFYIFLMLSFVNIFVFYTFLKNQKSDLEILNLENSSNYKNVISIDLLKEGSYFQNYNEFVIKENLNIRNIKNKKYFKSIYAPLYLGESGNFEILFNRRYEYLSKYESKKDFLKKNKYIYGYSGLYRDPEFWCNNLKNNAIIVYNFTFNNKHLHQVNYLKECK